MLAVESARAFDAWRETARRLIAAGVPPTDVEWSDATQPALDLFAAAGLPAGTGEEGPPLRVARELVRLLEAVAQYRDPSRWTLMYRLLWHARERGRAVLEDAADPDLCRAREWAKAVRRDIHKMHAYVRFREVASAHADEPPRYVAWFEPEHLILREGAKFFVRRFGNLRWSLVTPDGAAHWEDGRLRFEGSPPRDTLPRTDALEDLWRTYYRSICNVARLHTRTMQREMPMRYWKNLPEAREIAGLVRDAHRRVAAFDRAGDEQAWPRHAPIRSDGPAADARPPRIVELEACRRCPLWQRATQPCPGEGPEDARIVLVGEQPGDEEDLRGRPFVGPAGRLLDTLLAEAGLDRATLYVTNAVKHFSWEPRGKRRLHRTPAQREIEACRSWLADELATIKPAVIVTLGATAARAVTGSAEALGRLRERPPQEVAGAMLVATWHPSALLRAEPDRAAALRVQLVADLRRALSLSRRPTSAG